MAADLAQLEAALVKADAAGDAEGARVLAAEVRKARAAAKAGPTAAPESTLETVVKTPARLLGGAAETALTMGTGTAASVIGGLTGILAGATPGGPSAAGTVRDIQEALTYQPRSEMGKKMLGAVSYPFEKLAEAGDWLGGKTTDAASGVMPAEAAAGLGAAVNTGVQSLPMLIGPATAKVAPMLERGARRTMQSALKPTRQAIDTGKAGKAITTLLDEGINATESGAAKLRSKVDLLDGQVKEILANQPSGTVVDKGHVVDAFAQAYEKALRQGTPQADLAILDQALNQFLDHPLASGDKIPVKLAQEIKQGVWRKLGEKSFGKGLVPDASRDAQKAIGTGLRVGIEEVAPEVGPLNAKQGEYLNALKQVERRTGIEGNSNLVGLGMVSPTIERVMLWLLDRSPAAKSELAHLLNAGASASGEIAGPAGTLATMNAGQQQANRKRLQDLQK